MKQLKKWCIWMFAVMMMLLVTSCGNDDDKNDNNADIAITGSCIEVGENYARIEGYFNQKNISATYSSLQVGIEYSTNESFRGSHFVQSKVIEGNRFEVDIRGLNHSTDYYFRTCVKINSLNYVGKTSSFTTKEKIEDEDGKVKVEVHYGYDLSEVKYISGYDSIAEAFIKDLNKALESIQGKEVTDELVIQRVQSVVDAYDNDVIFGTLVLKTGNTPNIDLMRTLKTFSMTVNPKYIGE